MSIWSVEYHDKTILAMGPLPNTITIKRGVIFFKFLFRYAMNSRYIWKTDFLTI